MINLKVNIRNLKVNIRLFMANHFVKSSIDYFPIDRLSSDFVIELFKIYERGRTGQPS